MEAFFIHFKTYLIKLTSSSLKFFCLLLALARMMLVLNYCPGYRYVVTGF